eukprot:425843_1
MNPTNIPTMTPLAMNPYYLVNPSIAASNNPSYEPTYQLVNNPTTEPTIEPACSQQIHQLNLQQMHIIQVGFLLYKSNNISYYTSNYKFNKYPYYNNYIQQ